MISFTLLAVLLGCASQSQPQQTASTLDIDDDTYCRANGTVAPGSPQYIACRNDRDVQRDAATKGADRKQRDLAEYMLNHPDHP